MFLFSIFALVAIASAIRVSKPTASSTFSVPLARSEKRVNVHLGADHVSAMRADGVTHVQVAGQPGQGPVSIPIAGASKPHTRVGKSRFLLTAFRRKPAPRTTGRL
jgi:hypothetical protein